LGLARASPELSPRELALQITNAGAFSISESACYRLLKGNGLVKPAEVIGFKAANEYYRKTSRPNERDRTTLLSDNGPGLPVPHLRPLSPAPGDPPRRGFSLLPSDQR